MGFFFTPFDTFISSKLTCFNTVKIGCFFVKKTKIPTTTVIFDSIKTWRRTSCFFVSNFHLSGCFCFWTKEHPILTVLKQVSLDEMKLSNCIKPHDFFVSFFLTKEISVGKCLFWQRHNLETRNVSQLWWFFSTYNETIHPIVYQIIKTLMFFLVYEYFLKVLNHS